MGDKINLKKRIIIVSIVSVVLIVAALIVRFFVIPAFQNNTITGDWEMTVNPEMSASTADEADSAQKVYYTFSETGKYGDGEYKTIYDGGVEIGEYKISEKSGKDYINMGTEDLEYKIEGKKLTITFPETTDEQTGEKIPAQDYVFERTKAPEYEKESYSSFDTDKQLLSEWETEERSLAYFTTEFSYTETLNFNDNGVMTIHYESNDLALDRYMYYAYTAKDNTLTISPVTDKETKYAVSYKFDKDGNLTFTDDTTSASIFADEFFSDVTYHKTDGNK